MALNIIISIGIIYGMHSCWDFLKNNYTTKKTKDLVNTQIQKYKKMIDEIQNQKQIGSPNKLFESDQEKKSMNDDLMNFINEQMITDN